MFQVIVDELGYLAQLGLIIHLDQHPRDIHGPVVSLMTLRSRQRAAALVSAIANPLAYVTPFTAGQWSESCGRYVVRFYYA